MVDIGLINNNEGGAISFYVGNTDFREEFEFFIEKGKYSFRKTKNANATINLRKNKNMPLVDFFNEYPPIIKFVDQSTLEGNLLVRIKETAVSFERDNIIRWDWAGVDIRKESQGDQKAQDSIQFKVIESLKRDTDYSVIFDDDNSGEIADIVTIKEEEDVLLFGFYHCKYSHGDRPGARLNDLYEVCGQAEKSVSWMQDTRIIIDRMIKRENQRLRSGRPSRLEKGDLKKLKELKNKMRVYPSRAEVYIVQPGVDSKAISTGMERLLCGSSAYLMETYSIPMKLICS